jgi:uncharacterized YceG family protein
MYVNKILIRLSYGLLLFFTITITLGLVAVIESKILFFRSYIHEQAIAHPHQQLEAFPVSVNLYTQTIIEDLALNEELTASLASAEVRQKSWWRILADFLSGEDWYQNLASPQSRIVVVWAGERKEEITKNIGDVMGWNKDDRQQFIELMDSAYPIISEGKYFPGQYVTHKGATPADMQAVFLEKFTTEILDRYTPAVADHVPLSNTLIIASLLEREASDFENMREVSGVIWNRIFADMPLQLDATLQYARGSRPTEPSWWPRVRPADKYIDSPFNTYQHKGLPPAPIANPSVEAIIAALNPVATECIFYFHTRSGEYHCSATYEEHVAKLRAIYGRGS